MQLTSHIDMTIPFWGLIIAIAYACYYILQMKFQINHLANEFEDLKDEIHDLKKLIIKNFTTEL